MKILALEFSSEQRSAAVIDARAGVSPVPLGGASQSQSEKIKPIALIESALRKARIEREEIECIATGLGPGSYTGIRIAIALAQGWALARGVRLLGISSVECLAARAWSENVGSRVAVIVDAQRSEFYAATYYLSGSGPRAIEPLRLASRAELQIRAEAGELLIGPEANRWFASARSMFPDARAVAQLAASRRDFIPGEKLEPIYLRETTFIKAPPPRVV